MAKLQPKAAITSQSLARAKEGKALTEKMKATLAQAALERVQEMESEHASPSSSSEPASPSNRIEKKQKKRKALLLKKREVKKAKKKTEKEESVLSGGLAAVGLENEMPINEGGNMSRKARYKECVGARVLEETLNVGREMEVVIGGGAAARDDGGDGDEKVV